MATFSSVKINKILGKILNTATFSQQQQTLNSINTLIKLKPKLVPKPQLQEVGTAINTVYVDPLAGLISDQNKPFSPRIINWVEPYLISGIRYTSFYTEVNSGLSVGDRVFIIGGNYDSDALVKVNKYRRGRDGYKVLYIDRCQFVLDIDYTGVLPFSEDIPDNFIQVHYVSDEADFLQVNRQTTTKDGNFNYKFNYYQNNLIFTDQDFTNPLLANGYGGNSGLTSSPGFFVRNSSVNWTNISSSIMVGTFSFAKSITSTSSNDRLKIVNKTFTYGVTEFEKDVVYKFEVGPTQSVWVPDVKYKQPFLTKTNFRDGDFNGTWNVGMYGHPNYKIRWKGTKSTWATGTLMNTIWESGLLESSYTLPQSFTAEFDQYGIAYQKSTGPNNNGKGYNFIVDSKIESGTLKNASIYDTVLGTESNLYSIVKNYLTGSQSDYKVNVNKGYFEKCTFYNASIVDSELRKTLSVNTLLNNVKSINSNYTDSVVTKSNYISDSIIKILGYDEFPISVDVSSGSTFSSSSATTHKVYKFYIDKLSYDRLKMKDYFFIKGLKINDGNKELIHLFDNKFNLTATHQYSDFYYKIGTGSPITNLPQVGIPPVIIQNESFFKRGQEITCFLSTKEDNKYIYSSVYSATGSNPRYNKTFGINPKRNYSIDIVLSVDDTFNNIITNLNYNYDTTLTVDTLGTPSTVNLGNIIDVSNAYVLDSNFESGLVENTDWQSGNNVNYSYDLNINKYSVGGGIYNLTILTSSSIIIATTSYTLNKQETPSEWLSKTGSVVFLNSIDYDTSGRILSHTISASGSGYTSSSYVLTSSTQGIDSIFEITATDINSVISASVTNTGTSYTLGTYTNQSTGTTGSGTGLTLDYTVSGGGIVNAVTVNQPGLGYQLNDFVYILQPGYTGTQAVAQIDGIDTGGNVISATLSYGGLYYETGDLVTLQGGNDDCQLQVLSTTGSLTRLPDAYEVLDNTNGTLTLKEVYSGTNSILSSLLDRGVYSSVDMENRYGYIHTSKIHKSKIKSGLFRRSYISKSLIENNDLNTSDFDFQNYDNIKNLILSDMIFSNQSNILGKATYIYSFFKSGNDVWNNGIIFKSIWNGGTFSRGLVKDSSWDGGQFLTGRFYQSKSFDATPTIDTQFYYTNNLRSYYKDGLTTATVSNNRNSWKSGNFVTGEFVKSDWENGIFKNGRFYNSKWYNGTFSNGTIGDDTIPRESTKFYNGTIQYANVNNSTIVADDTSYFGETTQTIDWKTGVFNSGLFGTNILQTTASNVATWNDGVFNGGEFISDGVWKTGIFNGGKFISGYNWINAAGSITAISSTQSDYSWQDGEFNGGEFGNGKYVTNSTWFTGEFNGGTWKGKVWNKGVFTKGEFKGGATYSPVGGYNVDGMTQSNALYFVDSFSQSNFYGVWNDGFATIVKDDFIKDKKISTRRTRFNLQLRIPPRTLFTNMLWLGGTFSHPNAEMRNSVWLDGHFARGTFKSSSFNPYVKRNGSATQSFNLNDNFTEATGTCLWIDGILDNSDFYISQWKKGNFIIGTAFGMVWKNGVTNYMNAYNVFWEDGIFRNGNWYGSYFQYDGTINSLFNKEILYRGMSWSATSSVHLWNVFSGNSTNDSIVGSATYSSPTDIVTTSSR
jgi:hypothetical protein